MSSKVDPRVRAIKIQTGVAKRILKEKTMYEKEVIQTEARIEKMRAEGKDEYDIKKMGEVLDESKMMVPETLERLKNAYEDLKNKLEDVDEDIKTTSEYKDGQTVLDSCHEVVSNS